MKKIVTLSAFTLAAFRLQAQITIDQSSFSSWTPGIDTIMDVSNVNVTHGPNGVWDLSGATYDSPFTRTLYPLSHPDLPTASFIIPSFYSFAAFTYLSDMAYTWNAQGLHRVGEIVARQPYPIGSLTGNMQDSLVFLVQVIEYSAPRTILKFPMTMGTNWMSDFQFSTDFTISATPYGLNNAPGARSSRIEQLDSVTSWGKIRLKDAQGTTSGYVDVLGVKSIYAVQDSFFLAGAPAPTQLLSAFGLTQGQVSTYYRMNYYRPGHIESILFMNYTDATFTTHNAVQVHTDNLPQPTAVAAIMSETEVDVYPNPSKGLINITSGDMSASSKWSYQLVNVAGQVVSAGDLNMNSGHASINANPANTGMHFLRLYREGVQVKAQSIVLQ